MTPQLNPNSWSCLPTAFAISQGVPVDRWLEFVGHDGSEIVRVGPDPIQRRGFHPNEMIRVCLLDGDAVTRVEVFSQAQPGPAYTPAVFEFGWPQFHDQMFNSRGVLEVRTATGLGHAMAYVGHRDHARICDPANGSMFRYERLEDAELRYRYITALWRIDEMRPYVPPAD